MGVSHAARICPSKNVPVVKLGLLITRAHPSHEPAHITGCIAPVARSSCAGLCEAWLDLGDRQLVSTAQHSMRSFGAFKCCIHLVWARVQGRGW